MVFIEGHLTKFGPAKGRRRLKRLGTAALNNCPIDSADYVIMFLNTHTYIPIYYELIYILIRDLYIRKPMFNHRYIQ